MTNKSSNFTNYLLKRLQNANTTGISNFSQSTQDLSKSLSIFNSASLSDIQNFDYESALSAAAENYADEENETLTQIIQGLFEIKDIQELADTNGDGKISSTEAEALMQGLMSFDGNAKDLTISDIDKAIELLGIDLEDTASVAIEEAVEQLDEVEQPETAKATNSANQSGSTGSASSAGSAAQSSNAAQTKTKTAAETLEELEQKKQEIITEADKNIAAKEEEKDKLVEDNDKISDELKKDYSEAKADLKETQDKKTSLESDRDGYNSDLSGIEQDINALEGEKSTLRTDTDDEEINTQNKSRLGEIESQISAKQDKKAEYEQKIEEAEQQIKELEEKEKEQEEKLAEVEAEIAKADPELGQKMTQINSEIQELKTQKTSDVKDIDAQIKVKKEEANKEAKEAGENKGKASNDIGSGLVELASKYMGMNEADGSYKLFTNGRTEAWCADFVTYVVNEYAKEQGMDVKEGFGSPSVANLQSWAQKNGAYDDIASMSSADKQNYLNNELKAGDIIIWQRNGKSHTGIVKNVNSDGTFTTVEGNSSDQVKSNVISINDNQLSGFIKLNKVVV